CPRLRLYAPHCIQSPPTKSLRFPAGQNCAMRQTKTHCPGSASVACGEPFQILRAAMHLPGKSANRSSSIRGKRSQVLSAVAAAGHTPRRKFLDRPARDNGVRGGAASRATLPLLFSPTLGPPSPCSLRGTFIQL